MTIGGYDDPRRYDERVFAGVRQQLIQRLAGELQEAVRLAEASFIGEGPRLVLINRLPPDPFYATPQSEIRTAGADRRSIANPEELALRLASAGHAVLTTALEEASLATQIAVFTSADIIVAQHGAALANVIWARRHTRVIEIAPLEMATQLRQRDFFGRLAQCMAMPHERVWQDLPHGRVDPEPLIRNLRSSR